MKLRVTHRWNSNYSKTPVIGSTVNTAALDKTKVTDYIGNKVYEQGVLKKILVDGGYIEDGKYYFYQQDHLGNNRMVLTQEGSIVQREYYYPFGMTMPELENDNKHPYRYNGKELDQMHRLDLYDYSARYYDQAIGRFTTVDPHAESYYSISPYAYAANNPINVIDPNGMDTINLNYKGEIQNILAGGNDVMNITNKDGGIVSKDFGTGVFGTIFRGSFEDSNEKTVTYDIYHVNGKENALSIFEFLSDNFTSQNNGIEFSRTKWISGEGEILNLVSTSHEPLTDRGIGQYMARPDMNNGVFGGRYQRLEDDHNHPSGSRNPSPADLNGKSEKTGIANDHGFSMPKMRIYVPKIYNLKQNYWTY